MNGRAVTVGWLFLTVGIAVGGFWATQVEGSSDPRAQAMTVVDPKILVAIVSWVVYAFAVYARRAHRLERTAGRLAVGDRLHHRAAQLSARRGLPNEERQLLTCGFSLKESATGPHRSTCASGWTSHAPASSPRCRRSPRATWSARWWWSTCNRAEIYVAADGGCRGGGHRGVFHPITTRSPR